MNWLAHLVLSEADPHFRVGNVLADLLSITELRSLPDSFQPGIGRHRQIDAFTDSHPIVKTSVRRLDARFRRFGGVINDIFYDHLLTANWSQYQSIPITEFVDSFHRDVVECRNDIPGETFVLLQRMQSGAWLTSYGDVDGVRLTLTRMSRRLKRPFELGDAADELRRHYSDLESDFRQFFPEIRARFAR